MLPLVGLGIGLAGAVGKMFGRGKANRRMQALMAENPIYKENPIARERLGLAKSLLNARAPGAAMAEKNIYTNQANQLGQLQRNATDSSQLLSLGSQAVGQSNQAFNQLAMSEADDYQRRYGNVVGAQEGVIREGDKVFQDQTRRFQDKVQFEGAMNANRQANWGDVSNMGFGLMDFGMSGGFGKLFGAGGGGSAGPDAGISADPWAGTRNPSINYGLIGRSYP